MIEIKGNACKDVMIFTDNVETEAMSLIYSIANHPTFANTKIRIMPIIIMSIIIGIIAISTSRLWPIRLFFNLV